MRKKIGFLKKAIAKINGYFSRSGEKLVSARLTPEQVAEFNGGPAKKAAAVKTKATKVKAPTVDVVEKEVVGPAAEAVLAEVPPLTIKDIAVDEEVKKDGA